MNQPQSKFIPPLKSSFDFKTLELMRQKVNSLLNGRISVDSGRNYVNYSDGNVVYEVSPAASDIIFPFRIYNIKNVSATAAQRLLFSDAGLNIDTFTFQIRNGFVGARSYINAPGNTATFAPLIVTPSGNFEQQLGVVTTDTAPITQDFTAIGSYDIYYPISANTGTTTILDSTAPTLIEGVPYGSPLGTIPILTDQIVLNQTPDGFDQFLGWNAGFWIEIVDDPLNGFYTNLWGRMFTLDPPTSRVSNPFPQQNNIIPLGYVAIGRSGPSYTGTPVFYVEQFQTGNLVNRFPPTLGNQRGFWMGLYAALPAGITRLWFYPGDIVIDDSVTLMWNGGNYFGIYQMIGTAPQSYTSAFSPFTDPTNWLKIGMYPD